MHVGIVIQSVGAVVVAVCIIRNPNLRLGIFTVTHSQLLLSLLQHSTITAYTITSALLSLDTYVYCLWFWI